MDDAAKEVATASVGGETYYRLRDLATAVNGTAAQFNVEWKNGVIVITGEQYNTAALAPAAETTGIKETLTIQVDGKTVTTSRRRRKRQLLCPGKPAIHAGHPEHGIRGHTGDYHQVIPFSLHLSSPALSADSPRMPTHLWRIFRFSVFYLRSAAQGIPISVKRVI